MNVVNITQPRGVRCLSPTRSPGFERTNSAFRPALGQAEGPRLAPPPRVTAGPRVPSQPLGCGLPAPSRPPRPRPSRLSPVPHRGGARPPQAPARTAIAGLTATARRGGSGNGCGGSAAHARPPARGLPGRKREEEVRPSALITWHGSAGNRLRKRRRSDCGEQRC